MKCIKCNQISQNCKREIHSKKKELDACFRIELKLNVNTNNYKKKDFKHFQIKCNQIPQNCKREIHSKKNELQKNLGKKANSFPPR